MPEPDIIGLIASQLSPAPKSVVVPAGEDDCAVVEWTKNEYLVVTTDMLHESTDFPQGTSARRMGWTCIAQSLSDMASMGAVPLYLVVAVGLPEFDRKFVKELSAGMNACAGKYGACIIGGDVDKHDEITLVSTGLGKAKKELLLRRRGARAGDLLCVTGNLGNAAAAMKIRESGVAVDEKIKRTLDRSLLEPRPRVPEGIELSKTKAVTSMTDISDGLAVSLGDLSRASGVGFEIYEDRIPVAKHVKKVAELTGSDVKELSIYYGGDFELLFTVQKNKIDKVKKLSTKITVIGGVIPKGLFMDSEKIKIRGYQHF